MSVPPWHSDATAGKLFLLNTSATIRVVATETSAVVGAPFHRILSPTT